MPRIDPKYLDCAVYLYKSKKSAHKGEKSGGSGFLVHIPFEVELPGDKRSHVYVVTNSHVIREFKSTVIRLNRVGGTVEVIEYDYNNWVDDWDEDDLAVCMIDDTIMHRLRFHMPDLDEFVKENDIASEHNPRGLVDYGSDVAMIGRFISHDGTQKNLPVVRFGNVSMLNLEQIEESRKDIKGKDYTLKQDSFLVECRTIPGASGSPVFLAHSALNDYVIVQELLGIVWGYMWYNPKSSGDNVDIDRNLNTGMAQVIPAWKLAKFLNRDDLIMKRKEIEQKALEEAEQYKGSGASPAGAVLTEDEMVNVEFTEEDFEDALREVSRRDKPGDKKKSKKK